MDIRSALATQQYSASKLALKPEAKSDPSTTAAGQAASDFANTLKGAEQTAMSALTGEADPHALVQALAQTELAVETAVTVRDKVVEAYQEILRMQV